MTICFLSNSWGLFKMSIRTKLREKYYYFIKKRISKSLFSCGENLKIYGKPIIIYPECISVGDNFELNHDSIINATDSELIIGNNVTLSAGAQILAATYDVNSFMVEHKRIHKYNKTVIGDNVWIGAGAIIVAGVNISGNNIIIGANSVVTKDITESNVVVAGNPAKIIKWF